MKPDVLMQWFLNEKLPSIVKAGKFSDNNEPQTLEKCEVEAIEKYESNFASAPCFAKLTIQTPSGTIRRDILVKFQIQDPIIRERMKGNHMYFNEITMYQEIYPNFVEFLRYTGQSPNLIDEAIPKCYYTSLGDGDEEKAIVILKDLRNNGYKLSKSKLDLDLNHCLLAVEKLARFHSISLAMKFKKWKPFEKFKTMFTNTMIDDSAYYREQCEEFFWPVSNRGIEYLLSRDNCEVPKEYLYNLKKILEPICSLCQNLIKPQEPFAVLHHGDYNRNNILYKYTNEEVVDAILIDFQRVCYGSPSLDLGFLIYMNTTLEFREKHFDSVVQYYYSNLVKNVANMLGESEKSVSDRIPFQGFMEDFARVAIYHYIIVSFFLPVMMSPGELEFESDMKDKTNEELARKNYELGGENVSKRIADVIVDFYRRKFYM